MPLLRPRQLALILAVLLAATAVASLAFGSGAGWQTSLALADDISRSIVLDLRAPRFIGALAAGSVLASCGAAMQAQFRNPLAEPGLIGVSIGAGLGAAVALALGAPVVGVCGASFGGALTAALAAQKLVGSRAASSDLLLAGIAINAFASALLTLLISVVDDAALRSVTFWLLGSLALVDWTVAILLAGLALLCGGVLSRRWQACNVLLLGDKAAFHAGLDVMREKRLLNLLVALAVGMTVALTGTIGFIGLIVPHMVRRLAGGSYQTLLPLTALAGGVTLAAADLAARLLLAPAELPIGAITSLAGAPFFLWLLRQRRPA